MRRLIFALAVIFFASHSDSTAQNCAADEHTSECIPMLPDGFNFLKGYKIDGRGGEKTKVEYSYVFTKGTKYMINVCSPTEEPGIVINLFDSRRNQVASSSYNGQMLKAIQFPCNTTGIYYISYTLDDSSQYCGGSALGFNKS